MQRIFENWRSFMVERVGEAHEKDTDQVGLVIVLDSQERVLLLKRSEEVGYGANRWSIPGGHIQEDETFEEGAIRETKEETSIKLDNPQFVKHCKFDNDEYWFYQSKTKGGEITLNHENEHYDFFLKENLPDNLWSFFKVELNDLWSPC